MSMKKSNNIIENQTRDLPVCSEMPQPSVSPRAPKYREVGVIDFSISSTLYGAGCF